MLQRVYTLENAQAECSGIYAIRNTLNGRIYVGSAVNIRKRWNLHRHQLRLGIHHSKRLQRSWNKYGSDAFEFKILEVVGDSEKLIRYEQQWMEHFNSLDRLCGFNDLPAASRLGTKASPETREKLRKIHTGKRLSEVTKQRIREAQQRNNWKDIAADKMGKYFEAVAPDGSVYRGVGLNRFCKEHGLGIAHMAKIAAGIPRYKTHKGWTCKYI